MAELRDQSQLLRLPLLSQARRNGIESLRHEIHEPLLVLIALEANVTLISQSQHQRDDLAQAFLSLDQEHVPEIEARPLAPGCEVETSLLLLPPDELDSCSNTAHNLRDGPHRRGPKRAEREQRASLDRARS